MATIAGDEITEAIMRAFLVDFKTAEELKRDLASGSKYTLDYLDIGHMNHEQLQKYLREGVFAAK